MNEKACKKRLMVLSDSDASRCVVLANERSRSVFSSLLPPKESAFEKIV